MHARWILATTLALVTMGGTALAQPKKAEIEAAKKQAIAIADKGVEAFRGQKYEDAIVAFSSADKKFHVPKFVLYVARSQVKLDKLIEAKATYKTIVDEKLPPYAPDEFFTAQADAKKELVELEGRIPTVRIEVNGVAEGQAPTVTLDGVVLAASDLGRPLARNPGAHTIVVAAAGRPQLARTVNLRESGSESVILEMGITAAPLSTATLSAPTSAPTSAPPSAPPSAASSASGPDKPASGGIPGVTLAAYGVGLAGLAAGAVFGGLTLGKHDEFDKLAQTAKTRSLTTAERQQGVEAAQQGQTFGLISDIGFGTAVVGAAVGTIYWLVSGPKGDAKPASPKGSLFVAPSVGSAGGGVSFSGKF